ncbi:MAG: sel1 repeat family protein [Candidatus Riflebacteria bacterium]|nr:sel1 repeat family protein [Candidatus Riflebacteria bacterium]
MKEERERRKESFSEVLPLLLEESRLGNPHADYVLGHMYSNSTMDSETMNFWTKIDDSKAFEYFLRAAKAGLTPAMEILGMMIYIIPPGEIKAPLSSKFLSNAERLTWFQKSAEAGYSSAQLNLCWEYDHFMGPGFEHIGPHDLDKALYWAKRAFKCSFDGVERNMAVDSIRVVREHIAAEGGEIKAETDGEGAPERDKEPTPENDLTMPIPEN